MYVKKLLFFCLLTFSSLVSGEPTRLSPTVLQYRSTLNVDGSYSRCATLPNRLFFVKLEAHQMTWRHLWNYMSILVIALDTLNPSHATVVYWKRDLDIMLNRLRRIYLPGISDAYDYQVDYQLVMMVHEHLQKLLIPTDKMSDIYNQQHMTLNQFVDQRPAGTTFMFRALFAFWEAPIVTVQLLARSYLPYIYLLHMVHDANQVHDFELLTTFYSPIHQCIVEMTAFTELGDREDYEVALTFVDSNLMGAPEKP